MSKPEIIITAGLVVLGILGVSAGVLWLFILNAGYLV